MIRMAVTECACDVKEGRRQELAACRVGGGTWGRKRLQDTCTGMACDLIYNHVIHLH